MALSLANFAATSTIHMQMRVTCGLYERTNEQENLWSSTDWQPTIPAEHVGVLEEGSAEIDVSPTPSVIRFARWERSTTDRRLIINADGIISAFFDETTDAYRLTLVRETVGGGFEIMTSLPPSGESATRNFVDWRTNDNTLTDTEWNFINAIEAGDSVIIAVHEGDASYTVPVEITAEPLAAADVLDQPRITPAAIVATQALVAGDILNQPSIVPTVMLTAQPLAAVDQALQSHLYAILLKQPIVAADSLANPGVPQPSVTADLQSLVCADRMSSPLLFSFAPEYAFVIRKRQPYSGVVHFEGDVEIEA